ncbi:MAG: GTP-binding protein [Lysinibacillus sp.]
MKDVYLFSGFLGSGKTSMLTDVIRQLKGQGLKPAVIMNELGKLPFDSQAVEEDVPLKEMLEGCICCTGSEKTEAQIQSLLADSDFDVLVIETTGAAHPVEALDAVYSPLFAQELNVKGIVTVADSKLWLNRETLTPQVRSLFMEQIRHAHLLLANKTDLLTEAEQAKVVYELQSFNPHAFILQTTNGRVPLHLLEGLQATTPIDKSEIVKAPISSMQLGSRLVEFTDVQFTQEQFEDWVRQLPETVYRMKGFVPIKGVKNPMLFQYAYGMVQWLPEYIKIPAKLVVIGENVSAVQVIGLDAEN